MMVLDCEGGDAEADAEAGFRSLVLEPLAAARASSKGLRQLLGGVLAWEAAQRPSAAELLLRLEGS
jgi:hypothetical protein